MTPWAIDIGYGWIDPVLWLLATVFWWSAMICGHYEQDVAFAIVFAVAAGLTAAIMDHQPYERAYWRYARWEIREERSGSPSGWAERRVPQ